MWKCVGLREGGVAARVSPGTRAVWASSARPALGVRVQLAANSVAPSPKASVEGKSEGCRRRGPRLWLQSQRLGC